VLELGQVPQEGERVVGVGREGGGRHPAHQVVHRQARVVEGGAPPPA